MEEKYNAKCIYVYNIYDLFSYYNNINNKYL